MGCMGGCGGGKTKSTPQKTVSTGTRNSYQPNRTAGTIKGHAGYGKPRIRFGKRSGE